MTDHVDFPIAASQPEELLERQECICNSLNVAMDDSSLRYAEGIAKSSTLGVWYYHAWNVNDADEAVDYTWEKPGERYIGRVIDADEKWQAVTKAGVYHFDRSQMPYVPDGEMGLDCYTREQAEWLKERLAR